MVHSSTIGGREVMEAEAASSALSELIPAKVPEAAATRVVAALKEVFYGEEPTLAELAELTGEVVAGVAAGLAAGADKALVTRIVNKAKASVPPKVAGLAADGESPGAGRARSRSPRGPGAMAALAAAMAARESPAKRDEMMSAFEDASMDWTRRDGEWARAGVGRPAELADLGRLARPPGEVVFKLQAKVDAGHRRHRFVLPPWDLMEHVFPLLPASVRPKKEAGEGRFGGFPVFLICVFWWGMSVIGMICPACPVDGPAVEEGSQLRYFGVVELFSYLAVLILIAGDREEEDSTWVAIEYHNAFFHSLNEDWGDKALSLVAFKSALRADEVKDSIVKVARKAVKASKVKPPAPRPMAPRPSLAPGSLCPFFKSGTCRWGASCKMSHAGADGAVPVQRPVPAVAPGPRPPGGKGGRF